MKDNKVVMIMKAPGATVSDYDKVSETAFGTSRPSLDETPQECILHTAGQLDDKLVVADVWESAEAFRRFGEETIMPAIAKTGLKLDEPKLYPVYNSYVGGDARPGATGVLFKIKGGTTEQYDAIMEEIFGGHEIDGKAPAGLISHVVATTDDGLLVLDVWESADAFQRFGDEKLGPATKKAGLDAEPKIYSLHNAQIRSASREPSFA